MTDRSSEGVVTRNFLTLGGGEALARLIAFSATVYIARTLGAASYGVIGFAFAIYLYLARVADCGLEAGLGVREIAMDRSRLDTLAPSLLSVRFLVSLGITVLVAGAAIAFVPQPDGGVLAVWTLCLLAVGVNTRWIHLGLEQTRFASLARAAGELTMAVVVFLVVSDPGDVARVPLAQFIGDMLAAFLLAAWLHRRGIRLNLRIDLDRIRPYIARAMPMIWSGILGLVIYNSDLLFLRVFRGAAAVGYYAAAYALVSFLLNLGTAYNQSLLPTLTRLHADPRSEQALYDTASAHVFALTVPAAIGGAMLAPAIIDTVFGQSYGMSGVALRILMWSVPLLLIRGIPAVALMARGREDLVFRINLWATVLNLTLNVILIPRYGVMGAAWATVCTEVLRLGLASGLARSQGFAPPRLGRFWKSAAAASLMAVVLMILQSAALALAIAAGAATYFAALTLLRGVVFRRGRLPALNV